MRFLPKEFPLKDGRTGILRSPEPEDAFARIAWLRKVNGETPFMVRGAEETAVEEELVRQMIEDQLDDEKVMEIAAFLECEMVACGGISPVSRAHARRAHRAMFGISVCRDCWNLGIGSEILRELTDAARSMGYRQIELSVVADNIRAQALYEKSGFREMGRIPNALEYPDGTCRDEIMMVLEL